MTEYLSLRNWEKFQHYKDRRPPWIKLHVELLDDFGLRKLPIPTRFVYVQLLLVAAIHENRIPNDAKFIGSRIDLPTKTVSSALRNLIDNGFLEVCAGLDASAGLAERYTRDRGRDREETEAQKLLEVKARVADSLMIA